MSETNGTALPTSTNGTNGGMATLERSGFAKLLQNPAETSEKPGERVAVQPAAPSSPAAKPSKLSAAELVEQELAAEQLKVRKDQGLVELQRDTARLEMLSPRERKAERRQAEKLRAAERKLALLQQSTDIEQRTSAFKAAAGQTKIEHREQVWQTRAKARRERLMDPTSRLATIYRTQVGVSWVLVALTVIGVGWCAYSVGLALGGQWFAFAVEPLFSVPLLVIMTMHARAAQNRTTFPAGSADDPALRERQRRGILSLEIGLFVATTLLNVSPVVPGLGTWRDTATLLVHLCPPALIVIAVMLQPITSAFLSGLLTSVYIEAGVDTKRLDAEEVNLFQRVRTINTLWEAGQLRSANPNDPTDRTAGPSVKAVQDALGVRKEAVQAGVDGWWQMYGPAETQQAARI